MTRPVITTATTWANTPKDFQEPDSATFAEGFQGVVAQPDANLRKFPKASDQNWHMNRTDQALAHILDFGIPEWDANQEYSVSARTSYEGTEYIAIQSGIGKQPDTNTSFWKPVLKSTNVDDIQGIIDSITGEKDISDNGSIDFGSAFLGITIKWGKGVIPSGSLYSHTFPVPFSNKCFGVWLNRNTDTYVEPIYSHAQTRSGFKIKRPAAISGQTNFDYFAIGF